MNPAHDPAISEVARRATRIRMLARPADLRELPIAMLHLIMAIRLIALCDRAGRDPIVELALRLRSCAAATGLVGLSALLARSWPEPFITARPCCAAMTPDEATLAAMASSALAGDRSGFSDAIAGLVRAERHDALFDTTAGTLAAVCEALSPTADRAQA